MTDQEKPRFTQAPPSSGAEIGRLMIQDMCTTWSRQKKQLQGASTGKAHAPLLTESRRSALVASLSSPEDIAQYQHHREMHNLLALIPSRFASYRMLILSNVWQMLESIQTFHMAEIGNRYAYEHERQGQPWAEILFPEMGASSFVKKMEPLLPVLLGDVKNALHRLFAIDESLMILSEQLGVPTIQDLAPDEIPYKIIQEYNEAIQAAAQSIQRPGHPSEADRLRKKILSFAPSIDPEKEKPKPEQIEKARTYAQALERVYQDYNAFLNIFYEE